MTTRVINPIDLETVKEYLKENLSLDVEDISDFGIEKRQVIKLYLGEEKISSIYLG